MLPMRRLSSPSSTPCRSPINFRTSSLVDKNLGFKPTAVAQALCRHVGSCQSGCRKCCAIIGTQACMDMSDAQQDRQSCKNKWSSAHASGSHKPIGKDYNSFQTDSLFRCKCLHKAGRSPWPSWENLSEQTHQTSDASYALGIDQLLIQQPVNLQLLRQQQWHSLIQACQYLELPDC